MNSKSLSGRLIRETKHFYSFSPVGYKTHEKQLVKVVLIKMVAPENLPLVKGRSFPLHVDCQGHKNMTFKGMLYWPQIC